MARGGTEAFHFPELGLKKVALNECEIEMATRLVEDLTGDPSKVSRHLSRRSARAGESGKGLHIVEAASRSMGRL